MTGTASPFTAIILAGKRPGKDPVAEAAGVACKSFAPIAGRPMVHRVLDALTAARYVGPLILCGPPQSLIEQEPELKTRLESGEVNWIASHPTPSLSTYHALQAFPDNKPALVTTADHALLTPQIVDYFCDKSRRLRCDVSAGLTEYDGVMAAFPDTRRTAIKFQNGAYSGCNLFGFLNSKSDRAAQFWRRIEKERKKPLRMMQILGWWTIVQYLLGRISLDDGLERLSKKMQVSVRAVLLPFPQAAIDVDTADDWHFVQRLNQKQVF
ncbi:MAG: nucleotidyltransferase family protein [Desulfobacterales bacterium]|jgi:GTP:adenosylcobinamide-phosphate guanylyltransferase